MEPLAVYTSETAGRAGHEGDGTGAHPWSSLQAHHRRAAAARVLHHGLGEHRRTGSPACWLSRFAISADLLDPGRINIFERWESQAARETFRTSGPDKERRAAMLTVAVQEYIADVRAVFGERTARAAARTVP
jgi:hypothetical protein